MTIKELKEYLNTFDENFEIILWNGELQQRYELKASDISEDDEIPSCVEILIT